MLVLSSNLVLSEAEALPEGTPLILWDNIVTSANISADNEADGYPVTNLANPATSQEWRAGSTDSPSSADVEITVTTGSADDVDAVGIARHNFGSEAIAVEVGYYDTSSPPVWVSLAGPQIPPNDEPLLLWFTAQPLSHVVVRLYEGDDFARAAVLYVGKLLKMQRGVDIDKDIAVPRFSRRTEFVTGKSERGDYLGRIVTSQWIDSVEHTFSHLDPDWYRAYADPFVRAAQQDVPFFYAFAPDDYPYEVAFVWLQDDPIPLTNPVTRRKRLVLKVGGIIE
jgi:hypothetical protein